MPLLMAASGCCEGHLCDNCTICQRGRCCRKDNPDYQLPGLGEWDGKTYGELGMLNDDGEKVQCHCCGEWFDHLGNHVLLSHNLRADEYRSLFGLSATTGLIGSALARKRSIDTIQREFWKLAPNNLKELTLEQRSAVSRRPRRLQAKLHIRASQRKLHPVKTVVPRTTASPFRGVSAHGSKWRSRISYQGRLMFIGSFDTEEEAAHAYDDQARTIYGDVARLNFPAQTENNVKKT